jgi:hypothetical protein
MSGKSKSSLKRSRQEEEGDSQRTESDETLFWKNNYHEMKKLKQEAEEDLESEKLLRSSNDSILTEGKSLLKQRHKESSSEEEVCLSASGHDKEYLLEIIKFYETMTAMTVKMKGKNGGEFCCTVKNPGTRKAARFSISTSTADGELLYEPTANTSLFPEYMNEEALSFVPEMGPVLLGDAIASLFVEDESDEEDAEEDGVESEQDDK